MRLEIKCGLKINQFDMWMSVEFKLLNICFNKFHHNIVHIGLEVNRIGLPLNRLSSVTYSKLSNLTYR